MRPQAPCFDRGGDKPIDAAPPPVHDISTSVCLLSASSEKDKECYDESQTLFLVSTNCPLLPVDSTLQSDWICFQNSCS